MAKRAILQKESSESENVEETWAHYTVHGGTYRERFCHPYLAALLNDVGHVQVQEKLTYWSELREMFGEIRAYRSIYEHVYMSFLQQIESTIEEKKEEQDEEKKAWPSYAVDEFEKIVENSKGLENAGEDKSQILYHIMELETLLGRVERIAGATNRKYEARLTASLRDVCRVHEPSELSEEQIKCFKHCVIALVEGWGKLNKEKVRWIRYQLLDVGLTWLPITDKAVKDVLEAQKAKE